jgi:hypothetical protein
MNGKSRVRQWEATCYLIAPSNWQQHASTAGRLVLRSGYPPPPRSLGKRRLWYWIASPAREPSRDMTGSERELILSCRDRSINVERWRNHGARGAGNSIQITDTVLYCIINESWIHARRKLKLNDDAATATVPGRLVVCRSGTHGNSELTTRQESLGMAPSSSRQCHQQTIIAPFVLLSGFNLIPFPILTIIDAWRDRLQQCACQRWTETAHTHVCACQSSREYGMRWSRLSHTRGTRDGEENEFNLITPRLK